MFFTLLIIEGTDLIDPVGIIIAGVIAHFIADLRYQDQSYGHSRTERQSLYYCFLKFHIAFLFNLQ